MAHLVVAEVTRNGLVESVHHGSAVVLSPRGDVVFAAGDVDVPVYGRSSNKPLQGAAMVGLGLDLAPPLLALAVASHSGEEMHLQGVRAILDGVGLDEHSLQCVVAPPLGPEAARSMWRAGGRASRLTMNCSGKHAAMLATCVRNGWDRDSYRLPDHPLQLRISDVICALTEETPSVIGVDGCGAPAHALSLRGLARAFSFIACAESARAEHRVATAMRAHPEMVGGTGRDVTEAMRRVPGLIAKDGAEGVYAAALPDGRSVALKIADGSDRARLPVLVRLLEIAGADVAALGDLALPATLGGGEPVGSVRCVLIA